MLSINNNIFKYTMYSSVIALNIQDVVLIILVKPLYFLCTGLSTQNEILITLKI